MTTDNWQLGVDKAIQKAMAAGEFDNLPGTGKPLALDRTGSDPALWAAHNLLRNGGFKPDWIAERNRGREIEFMSYANRRIQTAANDVPSARAADDAQREFDFLVTTARTPCFDDRERMQLRSTLAACGRALEDAGHRVLVRCPTRWVFGVSRRIFRHSSRSTFRISTSVVRFTFASCRPCPG